MNLIVSAQMECGTMKELVKIVVINVKYVQMLQMIVLNQIVLETESETIVVAQLISGMITKQTVKNVLVNVKNVICKGVHLAQHSEKAQILVIAQMVIMKLSNMKLEMLNVPMKQAEMMELVSYVIINVKLVPQQDLVIHVNQQEPIEKPSPMEIHSNAHVWKDIMMMESTYVKHVTTNVNHVSTTILVKYVLKKAEIQTISVLAQMDGMMTELQYVNNVHTNVPNV